MGLKVTIVILLSLAWSVASWNWYTCKIKGLCEIKLTNVDDLTVAKLASPPDHKDNKNIEMDISPSRENAPVEINTFEADSDDIEQENKIDVEATLTAETTIEETVSNDQKSEVEPNVAVTRADLDESDVIVADHEKEVTIDETTDNSQKSEEIEPSIETARNDVDESNAIIAVPEEDIKEVDLVKVGLPENRLTKEIKQVEIVIKQKRQARVYFPFNNAKTPLLSSETEDYFRNVVNQLKAGSKVELIGHTDSAGDENLNLELGLSRAKLIKTMLIDRGAQATSISIASMGESQPIQSNSTKLGRSANRRVELSIIE